MPSSQLPRTATLHTIRLALHEDAASRDRTSRAVISHPTRIRARIVAKAAGILAGGPVAAWTFRALDSSLRVVVRRRDGARLARGHIVLTVDGRARSIFAAERTALNFLGHLSGIATLTAAYVRKTRPRRTVLLATRKTLPGLRHLEKYAVQIGGGQRHRMDLAEAILIKTNHLKALGRGGRTHLIQAAIAKAKRAHPRRTIEIEVTNLSELKAALKAKPNVILLDNWTLSNIRKAVRLRNSALRTPHSAFPLLEVSGGITLATVGAIARTGVDAISIGRLTHSAPSLNLSLTVG